MKTKTKILFLIEEAATGIFDTNVVAYFPQEHKTAFKYKGKIRKLYEHPGLDMGGLTVAKKDQYRNLLADLIVSGEKNVQVLNKQ